MIFFGILLIVLGVGFCGLGYLIAFREKFALINNFIDDLHRGRLDSAYARRTGLFEILWGLISILAGILVLLIRTWPFTWVALCITIIGTAGTLVAHTLFSLKKNK